MASKLQKWTAEKRTYESSVEGYGKPNLWKKWEKSPETLKVYLVIATVKSVQTGDSRDQQEKCNIANVYLNENNIRVAELFVIIPESQVCCIP